MLEEDHSIAFSNEFQACHLCLWTESLKWEIGIGEYPVTQPSAFTVIRYLRYLPLLESIKIQATPGDDLEAKEIVPLLKLSCNMSINSNASLAGPWFLICLKQNSFLSSFSNQSVCSFKAGMSSFILLLTSIILHLHHSWATRTVPQYKLFLSLYSNRKEKMERKLRCGT